MPRHWDAILLNPLPLDSCTLMLGKDSRSSSTITETPQKTAQHIHVRILHTVVSLHRELDLRNYKTSLNRNGNNTYLTHDDPGNSVYIPPSWVLAAWGADNMGTGYDTMKDAAPSILILALGRDLTESEGTRPATRQERITSSTHSHRQQRFDPD